MSFIHPDASLMATSEATNNTQHETPQNIPRSPTPRAEKMEIKIMLLKAQAESPLLPLKQDEVGSQQQASNSNNTSPGTTGTATATQKHISATPTNTAQSGSTAKPTYNYTALPANKNSNSKEIPSPQVTANECHRRSSLGNNCAAHLGEANNNNNNNNNNKGAFYAPIVESSSTTHTHDYKLYPQDTFARLEGKQPKYVTKMQSKVDAIGRITGEWGSWQLRTVLLIFLCKIPSSWFMACIIFTAPSPRHGEFFCKPSHTVGAQNQTQWIKVSHPQKEEVDDQEFTIDFCNVYQDAQQHAHHYYKYSNSEHEPHIWEQPERNVSVIPCTEFQHKAHYNSIVTQYDLVCSRDILVSVTQFFHLFGVLTGGILANHLLKYFSPRAVMLFGMITQIFCGNLTGHVSSYELHVFFRCLSAVCCAQMYTAGGMIMADITGGKYRTCVNTLFEQFWSIGVMLLPGVASFWSSWTYLYMAISWPTVILIYLWQWIPDSPRWLIARGRVAEAKKILLECAEYNGTRYNLPHDIDQQLELQAQTAMDATPPSGWWSMWKGEKHIKRHIFCVHMAWALYIVVYYGMLLNIRSFSREHLYVNTAVAGFSEMMGTFFGLFLIMKTTRKWLWTGIFNIVASCIAYCGWLVPHEPTVTLNQRVAMLMFSAMISKMAISTTLSILTTCTIELVSTEKRKITSFSTICWARFWLLGAPFIGSCVVFGQLVPQTAFGSLALLGGICTALISSPRTHPLTAAPAGSQGAQNMASQFTIIEGVDNKGYTPSTKPIYTSSTIKKLTTPQSNLPPQLMPGIWTTKMHEDEPPV